MNEPQDTSSQTEIKSIKTEYHNTTFRSRLEARWAIVFDNIGIEWKYEPRPFNVGTNTFIGYLPDFYIPSKKLWVEIKPIYLRENFKDIYMAGSICKNGWRNVFVDGLRSSPIESQLQVYNYSLIYVGPFFISCDHGCSHGSMTHGMGEGCQSWSEDTIPSGGDREKFVVNKCITQISKADTIFAWIDKVDCFGTLLELGYARGLNKDIRVAVDSKLENILKSSNVDNAHLLIKHDGERNVGSHEMWFLENISNKFIFSDNANSAFTTLYKDHFCEEEFKLKRVKEITNESAVLIYGAPNSFYRSLGYPDFLSYENKAFGDAVKYAMSYKFKDGGGNM